MERVCDIKASLGEKEICPEDDCPLWDEDQGGCVISGLRTDLYRNRNLAAYFLGIRTYLEASGKKLKKAFLT